MSGPVAVTGIGVAAPNGLGRDDYWAATLAGKSGIGIISLYDASTYPCRLAGEVPDYDESLNLPRKLTSQTDHMTHLALDCADAALADAGARPADIDEYRLAVVTANATGGTMFGQRELQKLWSGGPDHVSAYMSVAWFYAASTGQISIRHGMRGPCGVVAAEQAGGLDAIGMARRYVRDGVALAVTGGTDASLSPACLAAQLTTGWLSTVDEPTRAYLPFDHAATGYVPGQGSAILTLEPLDQARTRPARQVYGIVAGYAATFDPAPGSDRPPALRRAAELALADAGMRPDEVDVVFADAYGVPELDAAEAGVIEELFGRGGVPVTAPKTMTGRLYAGGGALDVATALLAMRDGVIPPTVHLTNPRTDYHLDLVRDEPREADLATVLVLARGYGGFNAAMVLTRFA
jgi:act minimal PKS chain-length factor (CLF/KS beta)